VGTFLLHRGVYGLTLFILIPIGVGFLAARCTNAPTASRAASAGIVVNLVLSGSFLFLGIEGAYCIVMSWPLIVPLGAVGGWLAYAAMRTRDGTGETAMLLLIPAGAGLFGWDIHARPPVFEVRSSIEIAAPPSVVWKNVVTFSDLPEPDEWYFRGGLAYPKRARIEGTGPGAIRYCEFSTGPFVEPIEVWDAPRLLRFRVTENPAPMQEWSPYARVLPKHLHGYFISKQGQFRLIPLDANHTLLEGTTWYQHGLWPAEYWRLWSDAIIHRIHLRVLTHIRTLSEGTELAR
jgi:hypothetical protein